jgi:signal transduction histidine kinase
MMKSRSSHVRLKIVALLVSMTALWGFAAAVTLRDGLNVLFVATLTDKVGKPTESLLDALQQERRVSVVAVSDGTEAQRRALAAGRAHTDAVLRTWRASTSGDGADLAATDQLKQRIVEAAGALDGIGRLRKDVDDGEKTGPEVVAGFTTMIDAGFAIYAAISGLDDQEIARQARTLVSLSRARELLSREDSLLAGALASGRLGDSDIVEFTKLVGTQRFLYASASIDLPPEDLARYEEVFAGRAVRGLRSLEDQIVEKARPGADPPFTAEAWQGVIDPAMAAIRQMELSAADNTVRRATPAAVGVIARLVLAGGLGLLAVIAAYIVSITTARSLIRQLERLRDAARDLAGNRLPLVVDRLSAGEPVDVAADAPPLKFGNDEIGQVGQAFNAVQETAVRAAVQQAELRRGVRDVFLSLARRTQNLVHKQLSVLDGMERRVTDADEVADLFRVDHLATRMRRNAENLIILSGATPGRAWRRPVPMIDVVRGALAEVEDYTRVNLLPVASGALLGRVVGDVVHLLAELIENAISFSPPYAAVNVAGQRVAHGFVVEIEDRGLGLSESDLAAVNRKLADPPDFSLVDASRLGHYVVAKLAHRHGIKVHMRPSPYGGAVAIVLIPSDLLAETDGVVVVPGAADPAPADGGAVGVAPQPAALPVRHAATALSAPSRRHRPEVTTAPAPPTPAGPTAPATPVAASTPAAPAEVTAADDAADAAPGGTRLTASGLPWRVRQASLAGQLRDTNGNGGDGAPTTQQPARDPELVRRMMRSYQHGTRLGRNETTDGTVPTGQPGPAGGDRGAEHDVPRHRWTEHPREEG